MSEPLPASAPACPVCGNAEGNVRHEAREMMFGLRHRFTYGECAACGLVWLLDPPADLAPYYPPNYYSFRRVEHRDRLRRLLLRGRTTDALGGFSPLGRLQRGRRPEPDFAPWFRQIGVGRNARILDVGCGQGHLLVELKEAGFRRLLGVDPYIATDIVHPNGVRVLKREVGEVEGTFDLVMLHHVFEHLGDPAGALREVTRVLAPGGTVLVRVPVADSWAWRHYGVDWAQLDAPRHFFLHTRASMDRLAAEVGLEVFHVAHDERGWTELASDAYGADVPLAEQSSEPDSALQAAANARAAERNRRGEGDQAAFYLRRAPDAARP